MNMRLLFALLVLGGCNQSGVGLPADVADGASSVDVASPDVWPKRVVLSEWLQAGGGGYDRDSLRLADGVVSAVTADLSVYQARVLSLRSPTPASLCPKGTFASLADVPVDETDCPAALANVWTQGAEIGFASTHTTAESLSGLSMLVRNADHTVLYRLRMVGDSYQPAGGTTATFDYEPVR